MLQHYGKATAIDLSDLIEDRRTIEDQSECLAPVISYENYRAQARRGRIKVLRKGGGKGGSVLVDYDSLPLELMPSMSQRSASGSATTTAAIEVLCSTTRSV